VDRPLAVGCDTKVGESVATVAAFGDTDSRVVEGRLAVARSCCCRKDSDGGCQVNR